jgi:hypothetical protein
VPVGGAADDFLHGLDLDGFAGKHFDFGAAGS